VKTNMSQMIIITLLKCKGWEMFYIYEKNDFVEIFKNLARYKSENNFVWKIIYQNNYVRRSN